MHTDTTTFASLLRDAADDIAKQERHPGQAIPGVWTIGGDYDPERLIVVIATAALMRVCRQRDLDIDRVLVSYVEVSKNISITPKGAPDVIAMQHLRDAADELVRAAEGRLRVAV
jgi:hypothetical protein